MSVTELFVRRIPLYANDDIVHNNVGSVLKQTIERLGLGCFHWEIYPLAKS